MARHSCRIFLFLHKNIATNPSPLPFSTSSDIVRGIPTIYHYLIQSPHCSPASTSIQTPPLLLSIAAMNTKPLVPSCQIPSTSFPCHCMNNITPSSAQQNLGLSPVNDITHQDNDDPSPHSDKIPTSSINNHPLHSTLNSTPHKNSKY
mmetsp:Transcript_16066/g.19992  ORF Transcript_16066/g.19992 Transcript_16066/m.19992 type:complete len:148 (-) Transcript_16066:685-1128(-)